MLNLSAMNVFVYPSPIGPLLLASKDGELIFLGPLSIHKDWLDEGNKAIDPPIKEAVAWLDDYFAGKPDPVDIPKRLSITPFQRKVYEALIAVPYGSTITYGELGKRIGCKGARAIGQALNRNPLLLFIPCHRVVGKNGLGGFAAGIESKRYLLAHEKGSS